MNYRHLNLLVALDEHRSLARAAERLCVTTPAVSKALRDIERALDAQLFNRGPRGISPTIYGDCMIRHARTVLAELSNASAEIRALKSGTIGSVALGVLPAAAPLLAPLGVVELKRRAPLIGVLLKEDTVDILVPELQLGRLDIIVGNIPSPRFRSGLVVEILFADDPVVVVSRVHHPLAGRRPIRWPQLLEYPWIIPPAGSSMRESFEGYLTKRRQLMAQNCVESSSIASNRMIIQGTDTLGFFSKQVAAYLADQKAIAVLRFNLGLRMGPIGAMWRKVSPPSPSAELMLTSLRTVAKAIVQR